jgi:tetratricopeptide (TPR) repeat protein
MLKKVISLSIFLFIFNMPIAYAQVYGSATASYLYDIAKNYYEQGNYREAIHEFKKVLLIDPKNKDAQEFIDFIKAELEMPKIIKEEVKLEEKIEVKEELAEMEAREKEAKEREEVIEKAILVALKEAEEKLKPRVSVQPIEVKKEEIPTKEIRPVVEPGAWTLREGSLYCELYNKYYWHHAQFNDEGKKVKWASRGRYREIRTELKTEYGLSDDLTLLTYIPYIEAHWKDDNGESQSQGFTDIWLGGKYCFLRDPLILSLQLRSKFPARYDEDRPPSLGSGKMDIESRLLAGKSFSPYLPAYTKAELGFKGRRGNPTNEIPYFLEFGYNLTDKWLLKTTLDGIEGISGTGKVDEDYTKWTISSIYKIMDEINLELGYGNTFAGKNSSAADEVIFNLSHIHYW